MHSASTAHSNERVLHTGRWLAVMKALATGQPPPLPMAACPMFHKGRNTPKASSNTTVAAQASQFKGLVGGVLQITAAGNETINSEAIAGSGRLGDLHHELAELEKAMSDPERADEMDRILERFGISAAVQITPKNAAAN